MARWILCVLLVAGSFLTVVPEADAWGCRKRCRIFHRRKCHYRYYHYRYYRYHHHVSHKPVQKPDPSQKTLNDLPQQK